MLEIKLSMSGPWREGGCYKWISELVWIVYTWWVIILTAAVKNSTTKFSMLNVKGTY